MAFRWGKIRRYGSIVLGWPFVVWAGGFLQKWMDKRGWLDDPPVAVGWITSVFIYILNQPWFMPAAAASIFFALGTWLDAVMRSFTKANEQERRMKLSRLAVRSRNLGNHLGRYVGSRGFNDPGLFAEIHAVINDLKGYKINYPTTANFSTNDGLRVYIAFFDMIAVYLEDNKVDEARRVASMLDETGIKSPPNDRI